MEYFFLGLMKLNNNEMPNFLTRGERIQLQFVVVLLKLAGEMMLVSYWDQGGLVLPPDIF